VDWYSAKPFEVVQIDLKHIRDHKALIHEHILHLDRYDIPDFQWGALDVHSRFKLIAYSQERSWTNGLCFYLWVISWLRSHGVKVTIIFTTDHGEEFGGKSWLKVQELCRLIQNRKGHLEENAHLERSHRTDDEEFYIPRALSLTTPQILRISGRSAPLRNPPTHPSAGQIPQAPMDYGIHHPSTICNLCKSLDFPDS